MPLKNGFIDKNWERYISNGTLLGDGLDMVAGFWKSLSNAFGWQSDTAKDTIYTEPPIDMLEQKLSLHVTTRASAKRAANLMITRLSPLPEDQIEWDIVGPHYSLDDSVENTENTGDQTVNTKRQYTLGIVRKIDLENWDRSQSQHSSLKTKGRKGDVYQFVSTLSRQTKRKQTLFGILAFTACYIGLLWGMAQWVNRPVIIADHWQEQTRTIRLDIRDMRAELKQIKAHSVLIESYQSSLDRVNLLDILASTAQNMPDGGWIREVNLSANQIKISGTTDNPSKLATLMEAKPFAQQVQLGAVSADRSSGLQRFTLTIILTNNFVGEHRE